MIIQTDNLVRIHYDFMNSRGQSLFKGQFVQQILLSIASQPAGIYFLRLVDDTGKQIGTILKISKR
ncbi:MAG: T9SS type A sorting domain-containing protein [Haliscomenobacter sp.]|nr:T9SS type A sorting domain-containing protein [Haliscomenobacter sp.]